MQYTQNFNLSKPEGGDYAKVATLNANTDIIDTELAKRPAVDEETGKFPESVLPLSTAAAKATPADADSLALLDSANGNNIKRLLWSQFKAVLGTVFAPLIHIHTWGDISDPPSSFTPSAHATTHKTGGADVLTASDIRAVSLDDKATDAQAIAGTDDEKWMSSAKTKSYVDNRVASATDALSTTDDSHLMTPKQTNYAIGKSVKVGDRVSQVSKLSGLFVPCNGGILDESLRSSLRGFASAHDFKPFAGMGEVSNPGSNNSEAYNNVGIAGGEPGVVVVAGAGQKSWYTQVSFSSTTLDSFVICFSPNPMLSGFTTKIYSTRGEMFVGVGYDMVTSKFWVVSYVYAGTTQYRVRVRTSTDGANWPAVDDSVIISLSNANGMISTKAINGKLFILRNGMGQAGLVFDLATSTTSSLSWPIAGTIQNGMYIAQDGLHMALYYNGYIYTTSNAGASWTSGNSIAGYNGICYSPTAGWILHTGGHAYQSTDGMTWTDRITLSGSAAYLYVCQSTGRVYMYSSSSSAAEPRLWYTLDGVTWGYMGVEWLMSFGGLYGLYGDETPIMKEVNGYFLFGVCINTSGNWLFGLFDSYSNLVDRASMPFDERFGVGRLATMYFTHDPVSGIIHVILYSEYSMTYKDDRFRSITIQIPVGKNRILLEQSDAIRQTDAFNYSIPFFGDENRAPRALFTPASVTTTSAYSRVYNDGNEKVENNPAAVVNFKGDWVAVSSRITTNTSTGGYIDFYVVGSSFCAKPMDGMLLCVGEE